MNKRTGSPRRARLVRTTRDHTLRKRDALAGDWCVGNANHPAVHSAKAWGILGPIDPTLPGGWLSMQSEMRRLIRDYQPVDTSFMLGDTYREWLARQPESRARRREWPIRAARAVHNGGHAALVGLRDAFVDIFNETFYR